MTVAGRPKTTAGRLRVQLVGADPGEYVRIRDVALFGRDDHAHSELLE
jgi:hypothetical protein